MDLHEWSNILPMKPLWLIKTEMRLQQIDADYEREQELIKKMSPGMLRIHIEEGHKKIKLKN